MRREMRTILMAISLSALSIFAQPSSLSLIGATNTQAVITYSASSDSPCTVEVSESPSYSPLVHDVDGTLFTEANLDSRATSVNSGIWRKVVVGARRVDLALDSVYYSRALQAYTTHYYRITCDGVARTGRFTTSNIPMGMTYQDIPQLDPANPGSSIVPTLSPTDRTQVVIDPHTGAQIRRVSLPADTAYNPSNQATTGPFQYFSGFTRVCGNVSITAGSDRGYLCAFAQGGGGLGVLYFIIPSTGEARYLGYNNWGAAYPYINPFDNKFYAQSGNDIVAITYTGTYAAAAPNTSVSSSRTTVISNFAAAIHTFDSSFIIADFPCSASPPVGDYMPIQCKRGDQDTYGWLAMLRISTGTIVAAAPVYKNVQCRWCGLHQTILVHDQPVLSITTHSLVGGRLGGGPYVNTYAGGSTLAIGSTAVTVSGEPSCSGCGTDADVPMAQVGDLFVFTDNNDYVAITGKTSPTSWAITPTGKTHAPGATLQAACTFTPLYWKFLADPHGTDTTNTDFIADHYWPVGGHDDFMTGLRITDSTGYPIVEGDLVDRLNTPITRTINNSPLFAGALAECFGDACTSHQSAWTGATWFTDFFAWSWTDISGTIAKVSGQLYQYTNTSFPLNPRYFATAAATGDYHSGAPHAIIDVSPGPIGIGAGDNYKFCISNAANECVSGSEKGNVYLNLPGSPPLFCSGGSSTCMGNFSGLSGVVQVGITPGMSRVISGGLTALRDTNDYPTAKALADGSWLLFAIGDTTFHTPSQILMAKLPPFVNTDSVDRSKFNAYSVRLTAPGGLGVVAARIKFSYLEHGTAAQYYCTSRAEPCVAVTAGAPPTDGSTDPFKYIMSDSYSGLPCASSCTIVLPLLPMHVAYYQTEFLDASNSVVATGLQSIAGDFAQGRSGERVSASEAGRPRRVINVGSHSRRAGR